MKIAITGGGTAGHVTPLLAVASELKNQFPESKITYIGMHKDPMRSIVDYSNSVDNQHSIMAGKFRRYHGLGLWSHLTDISTNLKNIRDFFYFIVGCIQSLAIFLFDRPNILFVKGGFVGLPVGLAAVFLRIPIVTHDSDSVPGLTNRVLSKYAKLQAVGMPIDYYKGIYDVSKLRYSGIPIQSDFRVGLDKQEARKAFGLQKNDRIVAIIGGSLGATRLNEFLFDNIDYLNSKDIKILWVAGNNTYEYYNQKLGSKNLSTNQCQIFDFVGSKDMAYILAAADLVVSRAGATAIAEIAAMTIPAIIVPNPILAGGHQMKNAEKLSKDRAVIVLSEFEISRNHRLFGDTIIELIDDEELQKRLASNIKKINVKDSNKKIVDVIKEVLKT